MADFSNNFWNLYVAGIVTFGLLFCLVMLIANMTAKEPGEPKLQGHVWDENLREYNNPLPRWWLYLFWVTVIFAVVYLVLYPGFGNRLSSSEQDYKGLRKEYAAEIEKADKDYGEVFKKFQSTDLAALAADPKAMEAGKHLFLTYCSQCHGAAGTGAAGQGFPNLADNDWLYGGDPATIKESISAGRGEGHSPGMTPFGGTLSSEQIRDVANYVRSLSGLQADAARVARGKDVFAANCTVCHGADAKGAVAMGVGALGAPNLTDNIWLYGNSEADIIEGVTKGRNMGPGSLTNVMPAWQDFLGEAKVHVLAAYVYSLSNKQ